jgi:ATP-binding cassette subfamily F protein 2
MPAKKKTEKKPKESKKAAAKAAEADAAAEIPEDETLADTLRREGIIATYAQDSSKIMHKNTRDITVSNLTVTFHGTPMIDDAELTLNYGNRYGFIGRNGCGKSTFMKVIGARCFPIPEGIDIFHLKEEIEATDMTAKEAVMSVDVERAKLEAEADELNDLMAEDEGNDETMDRLNQVYERLEELDATTAEARASKILNGLGFTAEKQQKKTKEFSGGWRMRIALARALFIQPTLLLLDEPTNHLDMEAVVWLEDYLSKWDKILFLVSHSQDFMNNVCTHIVHFHRKKLVYYGGNYDTFVNTRTEKEEEQEKRFKAEQDQIKHMKDYVAKFGQGNAKMARQAQSKEKVLGKMLRGGLTDKVEHEKALDFKFADPGKLAPPVLQCNDITFGYPGCEILYSGVDFGVDLDSRVALVGPNGAGKSTLLKIMTGELMPVVGDVRPHAHLRISKFSQHFIDVLDLSMTPLDYFMAIWTDMTREEGRKFLGRYGISGAVQTQIMEQLSDGQKSRVVLAKMARENPHMLFLDEPTNHLDMESIDSLAKAINGFSGGMVLVSHDMRLISQVANEIWLCDNRTVTKYAGEISDFKMQLRNQMSLGGGGAAAATVPLVPLTPMGKPNAGPKMTVAPPLPAKAPAAPAPAPAPMSEEESIRQARMELAEIAIQKQRARKAEEAKGKGAPEKEKTPQTSEPGSAEGSDAGSARQDGSEEVDELKLIKEQEKAAARAKRKAEKEAMAAEKQRQEEEREKRRLEKLRDIEEAKVLKEQQQRELEEFRVAKAARDAKKKAEEDAEEALRAAALQKRKEEKEARKRERKAEQAAAEAKARAEAEARVMSDPWTQEQQLAFEQALLEFTMYCKLDKAERWCNIADKVEGKSRNQCIERYRYLKEYVRKAKTLEKLAREDASLLG